MHTTQKLSFWSVAVIYLGSISQKQFPNDFQCLVHSFLEEKRYVHWNFWQDLAPIHKKLAQITVASYAVVHTTQKVFFWSVGVVYLGSIFQKQWFIIHYSFLEEKNVHWNGLQSLAPIHKKLAHFTVGSCAVVHKTQKLSFWSVAVIYLGSISQNQFPNEFQLIVHSCEKKGDLQKACPIYSSELCGRAHDTEAILLVCCRRLFGFNLPRAASSGLAAATAEQPFSLIVLKVCKKEPERRAIHGPA